MEKRRGNDGGSQRSGFRTGWLPVILLCHRRVSTSDCVFLFSRRVCLPRHRRVAARRCLPAFLPACLFRVLWCLGGLFAVVTVHPRDCRLACRPSRPPPGVAPWCPARPGLVPSGWGVAGRLASLPRLGEQLSEEQGIAAIEEFSSCDMTRIRNKRCSVAAVAAAVITAHKGLAASCSELVGLV